VTGAVKASYYDQVTLFLYDLWEQPSKAELNNQKPSVTVHIAIDASGNVRSATIVKKSGFAAMDASVDALLLKIKSRPLPQPPHGADEFDALLAIDSN
jgi:TonB family protein